MKLPPLLLAAGLAAAGGTAFAAEYGTVISATPVTTRVAVPHQTCRDEPQAYAPPTSGGGALLGAVIGGVFGNAIGGGSGQALATGVGAIAGAMTGDRLEAGSTPPAVATVRNCWTSTGYEDRVVGYDVVYEYNGQRRSARVAQHPGERIALDVAPAAGTVEAPAAVYAPTPVYASPPLYPAQPVYAPQPVVVAPPYGYYGWAPVVVPSIFIGAHWRHGGGRWHHGGHGHSHGGGRWRHH